MEVGGSEEFKAYIFADNYFELHVNGKLLAVDDVPFTQFNSNVARFTADRPVTLAIMKVDWEENLGLGSENNGGKAFYPGACGLVAHIQDARGETVAIIDAGPVASAEFCAGNASSEKTQGTGWAQSMPSGKPACSPDSQANTPIRKFCRGS